MAFNLDIDVKNIEHIEHQKNDNYFSWKKWIKFDKEEDFISWKDVKKFFIENDDVIEIITIIEDEVRLKDFIFYIENEEVVYKISWIDEDELSEETINAISDLSNYILDSEIV